MQFCPDNKVSYMYPYIYLQSFFLSLPQQFLSLGNRHVCNRYSIENSSLTYSLHLTSYGSLFPSTATRSLSNEI